MQPNKVKEIINNILVNKVKERHNSKGKKEVKLRKIRFQKERALDNQVL